MAPAPDRTWLFARRPMPSARVRLLCFPFGGGGASTFRGWQAALGEQVEVCPIQLPGRENRYGEALIDDVDAMVEAMLPALSPLFDRPLALLGYSMGAVVAYALAARCAGAGLADLRALICCARKPPPRSPVSDVEDTLSDGEFIDYVISLGGVDPAVFEDAAMRAIALRLLRTDFRLSSSLVEARDRRLSCRLVAVGGRDDRSAPPASLAGWSRVTRGRFAVRILAGGHFFLDGRLLAIVRRELASSVPNRIVAVHT